MSNRIFTRDNALSPALFLGVATFLLAVFGGVNIRLSAALGGLSALLVWFISMNFVHLEPDQFLVAENWTQQEVAENWIQKKPEDWIQRGSYRIIRYDSQTWGYAQLPISHRVRGRFYAGSTPMDPFTLPGAVTADDQVIEVELGLSYRLDPRAETRWTSDQLEGRFNWKEFVREETERDARAFIASLDLGNMLAHYREGTLQDELKDTLNEGFAASPVVIESVRVTVGRIHGEATMSRIKVTLGDGNTFYGDFAVAESIKNSFNKAAEAEVPGELRDLLKKLAGAVGKMSERLSKEKAQRAARALETLTTEATSQTPDRRWWEVSVEDLKRAAANVGEIGKPVLDIATRIAVILSGVSTG